MRISLCLPLLLAACGTASEPDQAQPVEASDSTPAAVPGATALPAQRTEAAVEPAASGAPGGLADDRTPVSEAPFTETSAQGAANVVQTYYALIESGKYADAWRLWADGGRASGMSAEAFAASFGKYRDYHAQIGAPGRIEGAAGSAYVEIPVQPYGRLQSGEEFHMAGPLRLKRCNDVPGCTEEQRKWRIVESGIRPRPR